MNTILRFLEMQLSELSDAVELLTEDISEFFLSFENYLIPTLILFTLILVVLFL